MDALIREWIASILKENLALVSIALRQRAKFEGWLKFELAAYAEQKGATRVEVESPGEGVYRSDLSFDFGGETFHVELKTLNTNWRMGGVVVKTRPITNNVQGVVVDGAKLKNCAGTGIVAFVLFPIPQQDGRWIEYLNRISEALNVPLSELVHTSRVLVPLQPGYSAEAIVCSFIVPKVAGGIK